MIRVFFACTIGFSIPIKDFWTAGVWMKAGVFLACMSGKLAIGLLATPPTMDMMLTLGFAWGEWGEFRDKQTPLCGLVSPVDMLCFDDAIFMPDGGEG